jgi:elongation factor G
MIDRRRIRNIGISAHIDSGKTTLTERILYYAQRIHRMHEVRGRDGVGATMDTLELERERGITIASAATYVDWDDHQVNIIDTPGHVDFTIEVERALRVLDGAVLVLCAVGGVQSQTITVDRQLRRYGVPCLAFVNKCDRTGANPVRVAEQLRERLRRNAVLMQIPIGLEADHAGLVDLVRMEACRFEGAFGERVVWEAIPPGLRLEAEARREEMLDALSLASDELAEAVLEERVTPELVHAAVRRGVLAREVVPVFLGSAYKNKGVQALLDAIVRYLPDPTETAGEAIDLSGEEPRPVALTGDPADELVALAFKLEEGPYGQLSYLRLYQGTLRQGDNAFNPRSGRRSRIGRLGRMHADQMEEITEASAGDIVALFGIECVSGDTFTGGTPITMRAMHVPEPVVSLAVKAADGKSEAKLAKALARFSKEDPTFRVQGDAATGQTLIRGMGELHLEVYLERIRREFGAEVEAGAPRVAYRETIGRRAPFAYTHKKQTGGAGQFARIEGHIEPAEDADFVFESRVIGGTVPAQFIPSCEKGFRAMLEEGPHAGFPVHGVRVVLADGAYHPVDSSDIAFQAAARAAFREAYPRAAPRVLEPLMLLSVEGPHEFHGEILGSIMRRRGIVLGTTEDEGFIRVDAHVPLAEMFGYATVLRSATQGKAEFTLEFARYAPAPAEVAAELVADYARRRQAGR